MKNKTKAKNVIKIIVYSGLMLFILLISITALYVHNTLKSVKAIDLSLSDDSKIYSTFYNNDGLVEEMNSFTQRKTVSLNEINKNTVNAFISIEDKDFYKHNGLNYKRIVKATLNNIKSLSFKEGASTITQQLVKNRYLSNEKTIDRKIKEAYLALKLENNESKEKILETYLNTIYFGNGAYGIHDASKLFFNKEPKELTLSEGCVLAGSIKAPSLYSPINHYENAVARRNLILREMYEDVMISKEEYDNAINEEINLSSDIYMLNSGNDLYNEFVIDEACKVLNVNKNNILYGGYKIYTYKDSGVQSILEKNIQNEENYHKNSFGNIADSLSIVIDNNSYGVSAIAGKSKYDLVNIKRQPGSLIKPIFVYAPALEEKEIYPCSEILDEEISIDGYAPHNVGNTFHGYVSVRDAISDSLNIPAVKVAEQIGLKTCKEYASKCGIDFSKYDNGYALALGGMTNGTTIKEITDSYSVFTNEGSYVKGRFIKEIIDNKGKSIYRDKMSESYTFREDTAYLMTEMLKYSVKNGTSKKLAKLPFDVAGKTGTVAVKGTNLNTDAYSLAYTTDHTMAVWLGNYTMQDEYNLEGSNNGGTYATKIILDTFSDLYKDHIPDNFAKPDSITERYIDEKSLTEDHIIFLADNIPERYRRLEIFSKQNIPSMQSNKFEKIYPFTFEIEEFKNSCKIVFDTNDYIEYDIYRIQNDKENLINSVTNNNGLYEYIDINIEPNINYSYYIIAKSKYAKDKYKTSAKTIRIDKQYNQLLNENNSSSYDWLFA